jgi:hypothetical protein
VPAAAVIPAPIAYIKVVAVKKLVVGFLLKTSGPYHVCASGSASASSRKTFLRLIAWSGSRDFYFEEIRVFTAGYRQNTLAWNNTIGSRFYFVGF